MKKFLPRSLNNPSGFTLIELLVVISIIAFLAVIGIVAFSQAQKQGRDGRRRADIEAITKAMESNYNPVSGVYPGTALTDAASGTYFSNGKVPTDPINSGSNVYTLSYQDSNKGFYVCAVLENTTQGNSGGVTVTAGPPFSMSLTAGTTQYCRISQQSQ